MGFPLSCLPPFYLLCARPPFGPAFRNRLLGGSPGLRTAWLNFLAQHFASKYSYIHILYIRYPVGRGLLYFVVFVFGLAATYIDKISRNLYPAGFVRPLVGLFLQYSLWVSRLWLNISKFAFYDVTFLRFLSIYI